MFSCRWKAQIWRIFNFRAYHFVCLDICFKYIMKTYSEKKIMTIFQALASVCGVVYGDCYRRPIVPYFHYVIYACMYTP
jgi:hypothetical protein